MPFGFCLHRNSFRRMACNYISWKKIECRRTQFWKPDGGCATEVEGQAGYSCGRVKIGPSWRSDTVPYWTIRMGNQGIGRLTCGM